MKVTAAPSEIHGTGVSAVQPIPRGEVVLKMDDSRIVDEEYPLREEIGENPDHQDWLPDGTTVLQGEPERYINHSCDPNVFVYSVDRSRFVLAVRDIQTGEEITYEYAINAVGGIVWRCSCGAETCRRIHRYGFFDLPTSLQLEYLPILDPWFAREHEDRIVALLNARAEQDGVENADKPRR